MNRSRGGFADHHARERPRLQSPPRRRTVLPETILITGDFLRAADMAENKSFFTITLPFERK
jgi:hypothetical protein